MFFVDLTQFDPMALEKLKWNQKIDSSVEGIHRYAIIPNQDFHAVVYVDAVSAAELRSLPPIMKVMTHIYGLWKSFRIWIISILILLSGLIAFKLIRRKKSG